MENPFFRQASISTSIQEPIKRLYILVGLRFGCTQFYSNPLQWYRGDRAVKKIPGGTSLAVQWLRLCTSNTGAMGSTPALKTKIPHAEGRGQKNEKKIHGDLEKTTICESDGLDSTSSCPVSAEGLARQDRALKDVSDPPGLLIWAWPD